MVIDMVLEIAMFHTLESNLDPTPTDIIVHAPHSPHLEASFPRSMPSTIPSLVEIRTAFNADSPARHENSDIATVRSIIPVEIGWRTRTSRYS